MSKKRGPIQGDPSAAFARNEKRENSVVAEDRRQLVGTGKFPEGRGIKAIRPNP